MKLLLSLLFIITLGACSPSKYSCPSVRGMSGYGYIQHGKPHCGIKGCKKHSYITTNGTVTACLKHSRKS